METENEHRPRKNKDAYDHGDGGISHAPTDCLNQVVAKNRKHHAANARTAHRDTERSAALLDEPILNKNRRRHNEHERACDSQNDAADVPLPKLGEKAHGSFNGREDEEAPRKEFPEVPFWKELRDKRIRKRRRNEVERQVEGDSASVKPQIVADRNEENATGIHDGAKRSSLQKAASDHDFPCIMDALLFLFH